MTNASIGLDALYIFFYSFTTKWPFLFPSSFFSTRPGFLCRMCSRSTRNFFSRFPTSIARLVHVLLPINCVSTENMPVFLPNSDPKLGFDFACGAHVFFIKNAFTLLLASSLGPFFAAAQVPAILASCVPPSLRVGCVLSSLPPVTRNGPAFVP